MAQLDRESSNLHHGERLSSEETLPRFDAVSRGEGGAEDQFRGAPSVSVTESLVLPPAQPPVGKDSVRTVSRNAAARGASPLRQLTSRLWGSECYFARPRDGTHQFRAVHVHPSGVLHFSVVDRTGSRCAPQEVPISCGCALFGIARLRGCSVAMSSLVRRLRSEGEAPEKAPAAGLDLAFDDSDEEDESVGTADMEEEIDRAVELASDPRCGVRAAGVSMLLRVSSDPAGHRAVSTHHMDSAASAAFRCVGCADVDTAIAAWALIHRLAAGSQSGRESVARALAHTDGGSPCGKPARELRPCERDAVSSVRTAALDALGPKRS